MKKTANVILVGAGPGDPELITLKGVKAIREADAIIYDSLSSRELLDYAKENCRIIYAGKRYGCKSASQDVINQLLVHCAQKYGLVVRLKGGDPTVFGRAQEEIDFVREHGFETEIIPGISSCIAVPASVGIPLTCRGVNESFWVTTATLKDGSLSSDIQLAAQSSATVVILMGLHKLGEISKLYASFNKQDIPCAVIQSGTTSRQKAVSGTMADIREKVLLAEISSPAIIVVGENVNRMENVEERVKAEIYATHNT